MPQAMLIVDLFPFIPIHSTRWTSASPFILIVCVYLLHLTEAFLPQINEHELLFSYKEQRYIEKYIGSTLELNCSALEAVRWILPDNKYVSTAYNRAEVEKRLHLIPGSDVGFLTLQLENINQLDTGEYKCVTEPSGHFSSVYVYVSDRKDERKVFINDPLLIIPTAVSDVSVTIPCRTNRFIENDVKLSINREPQKGGFEYDPRIGFVSKRHRTEHRSEMPFRCEYLSDSVEIILVPHQEVEVSTAPIIELTTDWPYAGQEILEMSCTFHTDRKYIHRMDWRCPRCDHEPDRIISNRYLKIKNGIKKRLIIHQLSVEDAGEYECVVSNTDDSSDVQVATHYLNVSSTMGQLQEVDSSEKVSFQEGDNIRLFFLAKSFPPEAYFTEWHQVFTDPTSPVEQRVPLKGESSFADGIHSDSYSIENAQVKHSGAYELTIRVGEDYIHRKLWNITVSATEAKPEIKLMAIDGEYDEVANVYVVKRGNDLDVHCTVKDVGRMDLRLFYKRDGGDEWIPISDAEILRYTFATTIEWRTIAVDHVQFRCEEMKSGNFDEKRVSVTDVLDITVDYKQIKPNNQLNESENVIFEGDNVDLICALPKHKTFRVSWMHEYSNPVETDVYDGEYSQKFIANLPRITHQQGGNYECIAESLDTSAVRRKSLHLEVIEVIAPHIDEALEEDQHRAEYGQRTSIVCPIVGTPRPIYRWRKNGYDFTGTGSHTDRIEFARVIVEDKGMYTCEATNRAGTQEASILLTLFNEPEYVHSSRNWWFLGLITVVVIIALIFAVILIFRQRRKSKIQQQQLIALYNQLMGQSTHQYTQPVIDPKHPLHERVEQLPYDRRFEINKDNLIIKQLLGGGQFGQVNLGELHKSRVSDAAAGTDMMEVAVKSPRDGRNVHHQKALADELKMMIAIGMHPNVLCLIGAVTKEMSTGHLYVVMEYCANNSLKSFLSKNSAGFLDEVQVETEIVDTEGYLTPSSSTPSSSQYYKAETVVGWAEDVDKERVKGSMLTTSDLLSFSYQVANGMEYLASRTCIHRDLAARNVLVTENRAIRIADFGLARKDQQIYHIRNSASVPLPLKWMALESILNSDFTEQSDIWAYGVLMWEIFTLGRVPYPDVSNDELLNYLQNGKRLEQPKFASDEIYHLMYSCWMADPSERPNFSECKILTRNHLSRASPPLSQRLLVLLEKDAANMSRYSEWRGSHVEENERELRAGRAALMRPATEGTREEHEYLRLNSP